MGISPEELSRRSPEAQLAMVRDKTAVGTAFDFYIKVKVDSYTGEFVGVVESMFPLDNIDDEVVNKILKTPSSAPRSPADFHTPGLLDSGSGSTSGSGSSAQRRGRGSRTKTKSANVKSKLEEFVDIIDLTTRSKLADYLEAIELSDD